MDNKRAKVFHRNSLTDARYIHYIPYTEQSFNKCTVISLVMVSVKNVSFASKLFIMTIEPGACL